MDMFINLVGAFVTNFCNNKAQLWIHCIWLVRACSAAGLPYYKNPSQHYKPRESNIHYKRLHLDYQRWMDKHLSRYEEVLRRRHKQHVRRVEEEKRRLESLYPGMEGEDLEAYVRDRMDQGGNKLQEYLNITAELNDHSKWTLILFRKMMLNTHYWAYGCWLTLGCKFETGH